MCKNFVLFCRILGIFILKISWNYRTSTLSKGIKTDK